MRPPSGRRQEPARHRRHGLAGQSGRAQRPRGPARRMARPAAHAAALPRGRAGRGHGAAAPDPDAGAAGAPPERLGPADGGRPRPGAGAPGPAPDHGRDGPNLRAALRPRGPSPLPRAHPCRRDAAHQHHQPSRLRRRLFLLLAGPASGAPHQLPQPGVHPGRGPHAGGPVPSRPGGHLRRGRPYGQHVAGPLRPGRRHGRQGGARRAAFVPLPPQQLLLPHGLQVLHHSADAACGPAARGGGPARRAAGARGQRRARRPGPQRS